MVKYATDPTVQTTIKDLETRLTDALQTLRQQATVTPDTSPEVVQGEIVEFQQTDPNGWQAILDQWATLPADLRNPERWKQGGKAALVQIGTDLTDNIFLNALIAFLDAASSTPD